MREDQSGYQGSFGSLDALGKTAQRVGNKPNFVDPFNSGARGTADVVKVIAVGAKCVAVGRL